MNEAAIFVPAPGRLRPAAARGGGRRRGVGGAARRLEQPELAAAAVARLAEDESYRGQEASKARTWAEEQSFERVAGQLDELYRGFDAPPRAPPRVERPPRGVHGSSPTAHAHELVQRLPTPVDELLDHAEAEGLGAIAITDHNVFGGAGGRRWPTVAT